MIVARVIRNSPEVLKLIASIDGFKGAWRALGTLASDRLSALRRVATLESIGSPTRIEGSELLDREVERLLSNLQIKSFTTRDEQEVAGGWNACSRLGRTLTASATRSSSISVSWWNVGISRSMGLAASRYTQLPRKGAPSGA